MAEPHGDMMDAILTQLGTELGAGIDIDEIDSREHLEVRIRKVPAVFVLFAGLEYAPPKVRGTPERQNQTWEWQVFVAAKGRARAAAGQDYGSLLLAVFDALRGLDLGEPGAVLRATREDFIEAIPGAVVYAQSWTAWRQQLT